MNLSQIISLFLGVSLFLFGMSLMGDGIKRASGDHLEAILFKLSNTKLKGVLLGTGVTAVIQSSSATSVMAVSFVNSGLMNLLQGISVIIGAILGTSITGWVICLSYIEGSGGLAALISTTTLTGVAGVIGILLKMFSKKPTYQNVGDIMMGFVVLMVGMSTMSSAVKTVGDQDWFKALLVNMNNPLLGILVGAAFTALLQSASAAVGIVQALSVTGSMTVGTSLPLLMGINIGASLPVLLSAIGVSTDGQRTALSYLVTAIFGTGIAALIFYGGHMLLSYPFLGVVVNPFSMAFLNTLFRLSATLITFPLISLIHLIVSTIIKEKTTTLESHMVALEERFIYRPAIAIEQCRQAVTDMGMTAFVVLNQSINQLFSYDEAAYDHIVELEQHIDEYEDTINNYLIQLTHQPLNDFQSGEVGKFLHVVSDFERLTDHSLNIAQNAKLIHDKGYNLSEGARHDFSVLSDAVIEIAKMAVDAFSNDDLELASLVEPLEDVIDGLCDKAEHHHVHRLQKGTCSIKQAFAYNNICNDLERVSDHCSNVALAILGVTHLGEIEEKETPEFIEHKKQFKTRFSL